MNNSTKKVIALALAAAMTMGACNSNSGNNESTKPEENNPA